MKACLYCVQTNIEGSHIVKTRENQDCCAGFGVTTLGAQFSGHPKNCALHYNDKKKLPNEQENRMMMFDADV